MIHARNATMTRRRLPLHELFEEGADALRGAAIRLAGPRGGALVDDIVDDLTVSPMVSRSTDTRLRALIDVLTLEHVDQDGSEEAARFASIDVTDLVVEDICLLTDQLQSAYALSVPEEGGKEGKAAA